ncbi:MAG: hypothetical protein QOI38_2421, partial [Sphingomonadales bacterium]|nr:hypothetical protein [Sphingomonadales bacterium]
LTTGEIQLIEATFPPRIDTRAVRISDGPGKNPVPAIAFMSERNHALTFVETIYYGTGYLDDFSAGDARAKALLLHEMTHVWQYAKLGTPVFLAKYVKDLVSVLFRAPRMYDYRPREPFATARLEAQAQMVQDFFIRRAAGHSLDDLKASLAGTRIYGL